MPLVERERDFSSGATASERQLAKQLRQDLPQIPQAYEGEDSLQTAAESHLHLVQSPRGCTIAWRQDSQFSPVSFAVSYTF